MALYRNIAGASGMGLFLEQDTGLYYGLPALSDYSEFDSPIIDYMSVPATTAPVQQTTDIPVTDVAVTDTGAVHPAFTGDITALLGLNDVTTAVPPLTPITTSGAVDPAPTIPIPITEQKLDWLPLAALAAAVAIAVGGEAFIPKYRKLIFVGTTGVLYYGLQTHVK